MCATLEGKYAHTYNLAIAEADADVACELPPRSEGIERVATVILLWTSPAFSPLPARISSGPFHGMAADGFSHEAAPINRSAKQVARERIATGACALAAKVPVKALDTRLAGVPLTARFAAAAGPSVQRTPGGMT